MDRTFPNKFTGLFLDKIFEGHLYPEKVNDFNIFIQTALRTNMIPVLQQIGIFKALF